MASSKAKTVAAVETKPPAPPPISAEMIFRAMQMQKEREDKLLIEQLGDLMAQADWAQQPKKQQAQSERRYTEEVLTEEEEDEDYGVPRATIIELFDELGGNEQLILRNVICEDIDKRKYLLCRRLAVIHLRREKARTLGEEEAYMDMVKKVGWDSDVDSDFEDYADDLYEDSPLPLEGETSGFKFGDKFFNAAETGDDDQFHDAYVTEEEDASYDESHEKRTHESHEHEKKAHTHESNTSQNERSTEHASKQQQTNVESDDDDYSLPSFPLSPPPPLVIVKLWAYSFPITLPSVQQPGRCDYHVLGPCFRLQLVCRDKNTTRPHHREAILLLDHETKTLALAIENNNEDDVMDYMCVTIQVPASFAEDCSLLLVVHPLLTNQVKPARAYGEVQEIASRYSGPPVLVGIQVKKLDRTAPTMDVTRTMVCEYCRTLAPDGVMFDCCSACKGAWYCSRNCQIDAWQKYHAYVCKLMAETKDQFPLVPQPLSALSIGTHKADGQ